jgi:hypothetical protein
LKEIGIERAVRSTVFAKREAGGIPWPALKPVVVEKRDPKDDPLDQTRQRAGDVALLSVRDKIKIYMKKD